MHSAAIYNTMAKNDHWQTNLNALRASQPDVANRLQGTVLDDHLTLSKDGAWMYQIQRTAYPLEASVDYIETTLAGLRPNSTVMLMGAGTGSLVQHLLRTEQVATLYLWDRDPALLVLLLSTNDLAQDIERQRLRIIMGADLVPLISTLQVDHTILHPLLSKVYTAEIHAWTHKTSAPWVAVRVGGLFCDDLHQALRESGYSPWPIELEHLAMDEINHSLNALNPVFLASVNYIYGMETLTQEHSFPIISWDIDPSLSPVRAPVSATDRTHLFMFRRSLCEQFKIAGYQHVSYLPLAADPQKRRPLVLDANDQHRFGANVSFVGQSLTAEARDNRNRFIQAYVQWKGSESVRQECEEKLDAALEPQRHTPARYLIPQLLEIHFEDFIRHWLVTYPDLNPVTLVAEIAAMEKRLTTLASLGQFQPSLWGDSGWQAIQEYGPLYKGFAGHNEELTKVYNGTLINIDVGRIYQNDMPPMRVFDVMACGAFILAEENPLLHELFEVDAEVVTWRSIDELKEKVAYYLNHSEERQAIADKGRQAVLNRHTITQRLQTMMLSANIEAT